MSADIADLLPHLTVQSIEPGDIVLDGMVLLRVTSTEGDGQPRLVVAVTPGLDWMLQVGMLDVARHICTTDIGPDEGDDE